MSYVAPVAPDADGDGQGPEFPAIAPSSPQKSAFRLPKGRFNGRETNGNRNCGDGVRRLLDRKRIDDYLDAQRQAILDDPQNVPSTPRAGRVDAIAFDAEPLPDGTLRLLRGDVVICELTAEEQAILRLELC